MTRRILFTAAAIAVFYGLISYSELYFQVSEDTDAPLISSSEEERAFAEEYMPAEERPTPTPHAEAMREQTVSAEQREPRVEILRLREQYKNEDIIGCLRIEGTSVDYPVTRTDDNDFYLDHDIFQDKSAAGWIFMDYENDIEREDKNTVIYGHNMRKDMMFHSLRYYVSKAFCENHRTIVFDTLYDEQVWEVFSFYETDTSFPYIQVIFPTTGDFYALALEMKARALYDTGVTIAADDRILTLSTCGGGSGDSRYVLNAKLLKDRLAEE